jgi:predicted metallo-beta-lactamase superfamily hydrolase
MVWGLGDNYNYNWFQKKSCYVLRTQIAITVIYTYDMFVLFCTCDVMNVLSVKKMKIYNNKIILKKINKKNNSNSTNTTSSDLSPQIKLLLFSFIKRFHISFKSTSISYFKDNNFKIQNMLLFRLHIS